MLQLINSISFKLFEFNLNFFIDERERERNLVKLISFFLFDEERNEMNLFFSF